MNMKLRLILMNFLEFAVWGAYLTSMGRYLATIGQGEHIGNYYAIQGVVSIFMPALIGIVADRWIQAQRVLAICHVLAGGFMLLAGWYGLTAGEGFDGSMLFVLYSLSVAFYMPTLAISNSVAFTALKSEGLDTVTSFPPIRVFGTIGFICAMWYVDLTGFQTTSDQFIVSGLLSLLLAVYSLLFLPNCPTGQGSKKTLSESLGLKAFALFKEKRMALFFIFSFLLGISLQITNGYANTYIGSFESVDGYQGLFFVEHSNLLISLSQISEALCILLIPFFLKRYGIKVVMLIAMFAWVLRFGFFGLGNPGSGVWLFILSCIVYGVAFDFFNVSGGLFVDESVDSSMRSSAQGLFMMMTNGLGATLGSLAAQYIINTNVFSQPLEAQEAGWRTSWFIFAGYALVVGVLFWILFRYKHQPAKE